MVCGQCGQALNPSLKGKTTVHSSLIFCRKSCLGRVDKFFALIKLAGRAGLYPMVSFGYYYARAAFLWGGLRRFNLDGSILRHQWRGLPKLACFRLPSRRGVKTQPPLKHKAWQNKGKFQPL